MPSSEDLAKASSILLLGFVSVLTVVGFAAYGVITAFGWEGLLILILFVAVCWLAIGLIMKLD